MLKNIEIANKVIGKNRPVFIIAEAGVNHNGNLKIALKLVDAAAVAGADAVKFQTYKAEEVVTATGEMAVYQKKNIGGSGKQATMLKKLELPDNFYGPLLRRCRDKKIIFLSTPHGGFNSVDLLQRLKVPAFKFGSGDLTNLPLLEYAAKFNKPMILGTGLATLAEVQTAINVIKKAGNSKIIVLHCTTSYPCPLNEVNLRAIITMKKNLDVLVGYSDHTLGTQVPTMAATMGACVIEKHFTLNKNMSGPDHKASLEPAELKQMVQAVRQVDVIMGFSDKKPTESEKELTEIARKSLVALVAINKGDKFTAQNLGVKRPGTGLAPKYYNEIIGLVSKKDIAADALIKKEYYDY